MRKISILSILAFVLVSVSCQKENLAGTNEGAFTVTASIENSTKTSFDASGEADSYPISWVAGDKIKIWNTEGTAFVYTATSAGANSAFTPDGAAFTGTFAAAYYPAEYATAFSEGKITANIPAEQTCVGNSTVASDLFPMIAEGSVNTESLDLNLTFHNLFGVICLKIKGNETQTITRIDVLAENNVLGEATIDASTGAVAFNNAEKTGKNISLVVSDASFGEMSSTAKKFFIAVPAGKQSFKIAVSATEGTVYPLYYKKTPSLSVEKSVLKDMPTLVLSDGADNFKRIVYPESIATHSPVLMYNGVIYAWENCGAKKRGNLKGANYQWGRSTGIYTPSPSNVKTFAERTGGVENEDEIYSDWGVNGVAPAVWGGTPMHPKAANDPCPDGWRIPTYTEMSCFSRISKETIEPLEGISYSVKVHNNTSLDGTYLPLYCANLVWATIQKTGTYATQSSCRYMSTTRPDVNNSTVCCSQGWRFGREMNWSEGYSVRCVSEYKDN